MSRYLFGAIRRDLSKKMVFISGPRQVGKTYLANALLKEMKSDQYYNWDRAEQRRLILKAAWDREKSLVVFDELHKLKKWKSWLKGIYDTETRPPAILVTGSARLDVFRRGGDSLMGRYLHYRLHPFSLKELVEQSHVSPKEGLKQLLSRSGFPEPLFSQEQIDIDRWRQSRLERVVREDIMSLEGVRQLAQVETLVGLLHERIASPLSYKSLSEDLGVSPPTVKAWVEMLERMYVIFRLFPYAKSSNRSIRKEAKVYFFDYSNLSDKGAQIENMVAAHLLRETHYLQDTQGVQIEVKMVRDKDRREVDFVLIRDGKPHTLVEVKTNEDRPTSALLYYKNKLGVSRAIQVVAGLEKSATHKGVQVLPLTDYLMSLHA